MSAKNLSNRQTSRKQIFSHEIRGLITVEGELEQTPFLVWDVSEDGVGVWVSEPFETGIRLVMTIGQPYLVVLDSEVIWCEKQGSHGGFRCGLKVANKKVIQSLIAATQLEQE